MEEKYFLNENGVTVTNVRFVSQGQIHALSGITSVRMLRKDPSRKLLVILAIFGAVELSFENAFATALGLTLLAVAVGGWFYWKPLFSVILSTASGESSALASKDGGFIQRVVQALSDAIVHRG